VLVSGVPCSTIDCNRQQSKLRHTDSRMYLHSTTLIGRVHSVHATCLAVI
jgi:hypothetical protein